MHPPNYMNEILFGQKNFLENKENFLLLAPYMLSHEVYATLGETLQMAQDIGFKTADINKGEPLGSAPVMPMPLKDTLFWSLYIAVEGEKEYTKLKHGGHNMVNVMMNTKKMLSDHFNKNPEQLKLINHRITLAKINEIKCNLMVKPFESIESCIPWSIYYNKPIIVYLESVKAHVKFVSKNYVSDDVDETIYLTLKNNKVAIGKPENLGYELYHYEKPLQGISNYKGDELKTIYEQMFESADMKKPEYYETIMVKCSSALQTKII